MTKKNLLFFTAIFSFISFACQATTMVCPEPKSILQNQGIPPQPWDWNPITGRAVVSGSDQFYKADILVAGHLGIAVACFYKKADRTIYSTWWQVPVARPIFNSDKWADVPSGYSCSGSIEECKFNVVTSN